MIIDRLRRQDRGAAVIEAALLLPVFFLLVIGIMDWSLYMRDSLAATESARVGVRTASALPRIPGFTQTTVDAIARAGSALPKDQIRQILVFKANSRGFPGPAGNVTMSCAGYETSCDRFVWNEASSKFVMSPDTTPWNPVAAVGQPGHINSCPAGFGGPPDSVGVYVEASHPRITGLLGVPTSVKDFAVLPFEPKQIGVCR